MSTLCHNHETSIIEKDNKDHKKKLKVTCI